MKYRIEECEVCGIMNPTLVIRGWADSTINHIKIKSPNQCSYLTYTNLTYLNFYCNMDHIQYT